MPRFLEITVSTIDAFNYRVGRFAMYLLFVMMVILLWSSFSKTFLVPSMWTLEMAQFALTAFYLLGGPYSMQLNSHVRMDLFYGAWSPKQKTWVDAFTIVCLIFYLGLLLFGGIESTLYSLEYGERSATAWRPYMSPIKIVMCVGIFLMLLQTVSIFIKDVAKLKGVESDVL